MFDELFPPTIFRPPGGLLVTMALPGSPSEPSGPPNGRFNVTSLACITMAFWLLLPCLLKLFYGEVRLFWSILRILDVPVPAILTFPSYWPLARVSKQAYTVLINELNIAFRVFPVFNRFSIY